MHFVCCPSVKRFLPSSFSNKAYILKYSSLGLITSDTKRRLAQTLWSNVFSAREITTPSAVELNGPFHSDDISVGSWYTDFESCGLRHARKNIDLDGSIWKANHFGRLKSRLSLTL